MPSDDLSQNQKATNEEILGVLIQAKEELEIPALMTSQFNEIGNFDYTTTGLNKRLEKLHEKGYVGHQKVGGRHIWWHSTSGTTDSVEVMSLEEMVNCENLSPDRFSQQKSKEIASENLVEFDKNYWQRLKSSGDNPSQLGGYLFLITLGGIIIGYGSDRFVVAAGLFIGLILIATGFLYFSIGTVGHYSSKYTKLPEEPFDGEDLENVLIQKVKNSI